MLNNKNPVLFKRLQKLNLSRRLEIAGSPEAGSLLSVLTPAQFSDLFPKAYRNPAYMPDVGGFRLAISRKSAEQQSAAAETLEKRLSSVEKTTADISKPWTQRLKEKVFGTGGAAPPITQLTGDQLSAWNKIQQGPLGVNSTEGKIFGKLSDSQLASIGVSKSKDNTGVDVYQYQSPEVSREEAVSRMSQKSGSNLKQIIDSAAAKNGINPRIMYGIVHGESGHGDRYDSKIDSKEESYGPFQMNKKGGLGNDFQKATGLDVSQPSSLQKQADWIAAEIAKRGGGDSARKWVASQWFGYGTQQLGSPGTSANAAQRAQLGDANWNSSWGSMGAGTGTVEPSVKPEGANGQYSDDQVNKMIGQLKAEKEQTRLGQFAALVTNNMSNTASINPIPGSESITGGATTKVSAVQHMMDIVGKSEHDPEQRELIRKFLETGGHGVNPEQTAWCAATVGSALRQSGIKDIPAAQGGNIATSYGNWGRGVNTGQESVQPGDVGVFMNHRKSGEALSPGQVGGHVGMLTGNSRTRSDGKLEVEMVEGNTGDRGSIKWHVIGERGLQIRRARPGVEYEEQTLSNIAEQTKVEIKPQIDPLNPPAVAPPTATPQAQAESAALNAPTTPGAPPPTATVEKPPAPIKSQPLRYKFDEQAFVKEVRAKETGAMFVSDEYILNETRKGFADTPGVKYNKGVITIDDPNSPAIKQIMNDMKSHNFEHDKFLSKMEEEKKKEQPKTTATVEPPKPKEQTPAAKPDVLNPPAQVPTAPTPQGQAESKQLNAPTTPPPQPEPKQVNPTVNPVPGASTGGSFEAPNGATFYPIDKRDDTIAVDSKTQEPLFTAKTGEGVSMNGGNIDVTPQEKMTNTNPAPNPLEAKLNNISSDLRSAFDNISQGQYGDAVRAPRLRETPNEMPNMIEQINNSIAQTVRSPSFGRAMGRVADPHFSYGNKRSES